MKASVMPSIMPLFIARKLSRSSKSLSKPNIYFSHFNHDSDPKCRHKHLQLKLNRM